MTQNEIFSSREVRVPIELKVKFRSLNVDQFIERYSIDMSSGGMFIRTKEPLDVGTLLYLEFQLQEGSPMIKGEGTVVWIRKHESAQSHLPPGMGIRFDQLEPQSQAVLEHILAEKQKRHVGSALGASSSPKAASSRSQEFEEEPTPSMELDEIHELIVKAGEQEASKK